MTSINFNAAATTALRTLQATNSALETSQNRVSTGLKIGEAKDNAAYWSISTTLKSDNKALGTVKDALGLGAATVDVAYQGLNKSLEVLNEIKSKLTASTQDGVDKKAVQAEIAELQKQLTSIATASTFSGENWLSVNSGTATYSAAKTVVSSFNRTADGAVSVDTIAIDTSTFVLIDSDEDVAGILEGSEASEAATDLATAIGAAVAADGANEAAPGDGDAEDSTSTITFGADPIVLGASETLSFKIAIGGGTATTVTITQAMINAALTVTDGTIGSAEDFADVLTAAFAAANITGLTVADNTNDVVITSAASADGATGGPAIVISAAAATGQVGVLELDITGKTRSEIEVMISAVNTAANAVTTGAAQLGAVSKRIELQETFVNTLIDTIDKGVSGLIDADLSEESTRLQALQTKQQLGIQALSIANSSAQNVLSLFRS